MTLRFGTVWPYFNESSCCVFLSEIHFICLLDELIRLPVDFALSDTELESELVARRYIRVGGLCGLVLPGWQQNNAQNEQEYGRVNGSCRSGGRTPPWAVVIACQLISSRRRLILIIALIESHLCTLLAFKCCRLFLLLSPFATCPQFSAAPF